MRLVCDIARWGCAAMGNGFYSVVADGVVLNVKAVPRSSKCGIGERFGDAVKVHIHSAPVDGKANAELQAVIAKAFGIAKRDVEILSGDTSKTKRILLRGIAEDALKSL